MEYGATLVSIETPGNSATAQMRFERYEPRGTISVADRDPMSWQYAPLQRKILMKTIAKRFSLLQSSIAKVCQEEWKNA